MSKSLNFVVSIKLDRRSVDVNGNHPIKLRVWNRASKRVKMYSCNKFSDPGTFEKAMNHKATVKGDTFVLRTYLERVLSNATDVLEGNVVKSHEDFEKFMFGRTKQSADLYHYIDRKIDECDKNQQYSSKDIYKGLKKLLESFSEGKSIEITHLSVKWFESLESWYLGRKKSNGDDYKISGYSIYIRHLRIIINELVDEELLSQKDYPLLSQTQTGAWVLENSFFIGTGVDDLIFNPY